MSKVDDCDLQSLLCKFSPYIRENGCVFVDGETIRDLMKKKGITQTRLVAETKIGKGTISNWIRGKVDPTTKIKTPWLGSLEYVAMLAKYLDVEILSLIVTEPILIESHVRGTQFFSNTISSPCDTKLGLLTGRMEIEADLDLNHNAPETSREWILKGVIGYVEQVGNFIGFTSAGEVHDNGLIFSKATFHGQLTEHGHYLGGCFEFEGADRWQYGMIIAHRSGRRSFIGRWIGRNSSFGHSPIGGSFFARILQ